MRDRVRARIKTPISLPLSHLRLHISPYTILNVSLFFTPSGCYDIYVLAFCLLYALILSTAYLCIWLTVCVSKSSPAYLYIYLSDALYFSWFVWSISPLYSHITSKQSKAEKIKFASLLQYSLFFSNAANYSLFISLLLFFWICFVLLLCFDYNCFPFFFNVHFISFLSSIFFFFLPHHCITFLSLSSLCLLILWRSMTLLQLIVRCLLVHSLFYISYHNIHRFATTIQWNTEKGNSKKRGKT